MNFKMDENNYGVHIYFVNYNLSWTYLSDYIKLVVHNFIITVQKCEFSSSLRNVLRKFEKKVFREFAIFIFRFTYHSM